MGVEPVPDHQQRRADLATDIPQGLDDTAARDGGAEMTGIQPSIRRDRHHTRDLAPLAQPLEDRGDPAPRPGRAWPRPEAVAGLVPEEERALLPLRLFLSAIQSRLGQTAMTSSSRSRARVAGRCTLKPCTLRGRSR